MRYGMVIDSRKCVGCRTCHMACKQANNLPNGVWWGRLAVEEEGSFPALSRKYYPVMCQHCSDPLCVDVCPTGASYVDEETGVVLVDQEKCIGCESCIQACPYDVRTLLSSEPEYYSDHALGDSSAPAHLVDTTEKCNFCKDRVSKGEDPACMVLCPQKARYWGDFDDPDSEVSRLIAENDYFILMEEEGTNPSTYYLK